ncbi:MAG: PqqD family protein [Acidobacteriota bacterium]
MESAFEALQEQYDVQPEALREDLVELLEKLLDKGLLEIDGG